MYKSRMASNGIRSTLNFVTKDEVVQKLKREIQIHIDTDIHTCSMVIL
jgi:hypothetical protein